MTLLATRRETLVSNLEEQLSIKPSTVADLLKAAAKPVPTKYVPRTVKAGEEAKFLPEVPKWAESMVCPRCSGVMKICKAKEDKFWGESILYQCHNPFEGTLCLLTVEVSTSNIFKMEPLDFFPGDISWKKVAIETPVIVGSAEEVVVYPYKKAPPSPWTRKTLLSVAYDVFWREYLKSGEIGYDALWTEVLNILPKHKGNPKTDVAKANFIKHVEKVSGWVISNRKGMLTIAGRGKGNPELEPFSSVKYRTDFGFE